MSYCPHDHIQLYLKQTYKELGYTTKVELANVVIQTVQWESGLGKQTVVSIVRLNASRRYGIVVPV